MLPINSYTLGYSKLVNTSQLNNVYNFIIKFLFLYFLVETRSIQYSKTSRTTALLLTYGAVASIAYTQLIKDYTHNTGTSILADAGG